MYNTYIEIMEMMVWIFATTTAVMLAVVIYEGFKSRRERRIARDHERKMLERFDLILDILERVDKKFSGPRAQTSEDPFPADQGIVAPLPESDVICEKGDPGQGSCGPVRDDTPGTNQEVVALPPEPGIICEEVPVGGPCLTH